MVCGLKGSEFCQVEPSADGVRCAPIPFSDIEMQPVVVWRDAGFIFDPLMGGCNEFVGIFDISTVEFWVIRLTFFEHWKRHQYRFFGSRLSQSKNSSGSHRILPPPILMGAGNSDFRTRRKTVDLETAMTVMTSETVISGW